MKKHPVLLHSLKCLQVNTRHLSDETLKVMPELVNLKSRCIEIYAKTGINNRSEGWLVRTNPDYELDKIAEKLPDDLIAILRYAQQYDCHIVDFDYDSGLQTNELPMYSPTD